ncbi:MAG: MopE-related protein [Polyangiales bacterium]
MNRSVLVLAALMSATLFNACRNEPYCLNCVDGQAVADGSTSDGNSVDAGDARSDAAADVAADVARDVFVPDGCMPGAEELCNGVDDNCDGRIDEGFDLQTSSRNCGACGNECVLPRAIPVCQMGTCRIAMNGCDTNFYDLDGNPMNGCEYACTPVPGAMNDSTCDRRDDDCDGQIDEDVDLCSDNRNCGMCGRNCAPANAVGRCARTDPMMACSAANTACQIASCNMGFVDVDGRPENGCEYECTSTGAEVCDGRDNDCDGMIDEGNPGSGMACGSNTGTCRQGMTACVMGRIACMGETGPSTELCDGQDNDCDGMTDEDLTGDMRIGGVCGTGVGECRPGRNACMGGAIVCMGAVTPQPERCDSRDNDCNGMIDDGIASMGSCGSNVGACRAGTLSCVGGNTQCVGATLASAERCNSIDDDCNGVVDNGFDLQNDPANCGRCGNACAAAANAVVACRTGACQLIACAPGFYNIDGNAANGCEYACTFQGSTEVCNGRDDNCNGMTDEGVTAPANFCRSTGLCAGATATCMGASGFVCNYDARVELDPMTRQPVAVETRCNGIDDNCNGATDESFSNLGTMCSNGGTGSCGATGTFRCTADARSTECSAPPRGMPGTEICDGLDNDCDGSIDETSTSPGANAAFVATSWVSLGANRWMMAYEASRPGATAISQGTATARACSQSGVLPWTNLTGPQAEAACAAIGAQLCTAAEWQSTCEGTTTCDWSYNSVAPTCDTYSSTTCNGVDNDIDSAMAGIQNGLLPTGNRTSCRPSNRAIFDLSGNAKEFTQASAGVYNLRGGSYNNLAFGTTCQFGFTRVDNQFRFVNAGFRCCFTGVTPP